LSSKDAKIGQAESGDQAIVWIVTGDVTRATSTSVCSILPGLISAGSVEADSSLASVCSEVFSTELGSKVFGTGMRLIFRGRRLVRKAGMRRIAGKRANYKGKEFNGTCDENPVPGNFTAPPSPGLWPTARIGIRDSTTGGLQDKEKEQVFF